MAGVIKVNPSPVITGFEQIGKKITWFEVSATNIPVYVAPTVSTGELDGYQTNGALQALFSVIQKTTTIIAAGPVIVDGVLSIAVEGEFTGQDNFDGTLLDGDLARMLADIQALGITVGAGDWVSEDGTTGTYTGLDLSGTVITASDFVLAPNGATIAPTP